MNETTGTGGGNPRPGDPDFDLEAWVEEFLEEDPAAPEDGAGNDLPPDEREGGAAPDGQGPGLAGLLGQEPLLSDEVKSLTDGRIHYDCTTWSGESRRFLAATLNMRKIPHAWQGTELIVPGDREDEVDVIVEELIGMAQPALDPERDKVVYEVGEWSAAMQTSIAGALSAAGLPYEWDEQGDLVVYAEDEERVEAIFDELPEDEDEGADDGLAVHQELDRLFAASGRLHRKPDDSSAIVEFATVAERLEHLRVPFGFEANQWRTLVERARALRDALDATEEDVADEDLKEMAGDVRDLVRTYI